MANKYFNWKLAIVLVMGLAVLAATAFGLRHWQRGRRASQGILHGSKAYEQGQWKEAAGQFGKYLSIVPDDVDILLKYADSQLNIRPLKSTNVQQAIAAYRTVLRLKPDYFDAALRLSELYLASGIPAEAEQVAARILQTSPSAKLRMILAVSMIDQRKFSEADKELQNLINDNHDCIQAYDILGKLIERRPEDFNVSPQYWYDQAVKNNSSSALAYILRGANYLSLKEPKKAISDFNEAEKKDLSDPNIRLQLADNFIAVGDFKKARNHIQIVADVNPENQNLWRIWAQLAIRSADTSEMIEVADNGLKSLSSHQWDFMPLASELYIRAGQIDKASQCISQLRKNDIYPSTMAFLEGLLAENKGQNYEAIKCWQRALDMRGEPGTLRIKLANAYTNLGDIQSAIKQLRTLISEQPDHMAAKVNLAKLLADSGRWSESLEQARAALKLNPNDITAAVIYAQARVNLLHNSENVYNSVITSDIDEYLKKLEVATSGIPEIKLLQIQMALYRKDLSLAESLYDEIKAAYPSDTRVSLAKAIILITQNKTNEALELIQDDVNKFPDSFVLIRSYAGLLLSEDLVQQCENMINQAIQNSKKPAFKKQTSLFLAELYSNWNEEAKKCELLKNLAAEYPNDIIVLRSSLTCPAVFRNITESQKIIDQIKSLEGENGWQWRYEQCRIWFAGNDFKTYYPQITSMTKDILLADPENQPCRMLLAASYEKAGDIRLAIAVYEEALNRSPGDIRMIVLTAGALYKAKEYERAEQILRRATQDKPDSLELKQMQLQSYIRRGELNSASGVLKDLLASDPNNQSIGLSLSFLQMQQGHLEEAGKTLNALNTGDLNSLPVLAAKIELKINQGKTDEAIEMCNEIVQKFQGASSVLLRARMFSFLGQNDKAEADFNKAVSQEPNNPEVWIAKSNYYRNLGQLNKAIEDISRALKLDPENEKALKIAILLYLESQESDKRMQGSNLLEKTLAANPDDIELRLYKARLLASNDTSPSLKDAKDILESIIEQQPLSSEAWLLLAEVTERQGKMAEAMDITLRALAYRPNDKPLLLFRAKLLKNRSPMLAVPVIRAIREVDPNDNEALAYLAQLYIESGEYRQAISLLKSQLNSKTNTSIVKSLKLILATALYKAGNYDEAEKIFSELMEAFPNDTAPMFAKIKVLKTDDKSSNQINTLVQTWRASHPNDLNFSLMVANDLAGGESAELKNLAESLLKEIIQQEPDSRNALYSLAMLYQMSGRYNEAIDLYNKIISLDPNFIIASNNLAWILCENQKQYQKALDLTESALQKEPNYIDLIDTRGMIFYRIGSYERAIDDFKRCVNLYPAGRASLTSSYFHLGRAFDKLGKTAQAFENITKAIDLNNALGGLNHDELAEAGQLLRKLTEGGN